MMLVAPACGGGHEKFPKLTPFAPDLAERLHAIRDKASDVRKLPANLGAAEGQLSRDTLRAYTEKQTAKTTAKERQQLEAFNDAFRLLHLIGPDDDLLELFTGFFAEDTLGFYVVSENKLALVAEESTISPQDELVLAHEYIHSFQDEAFDIDRLRKLAGDEDKDENSKTEYGTTIECLEEGDASLGEIKYAEAVYGPDWRDKTREQDTGNQAASGPEIPLAIRRYFAFDYSECPAFVAALYAKGGWDTVDQAYKDPPWTTEQILHPEKYLSRESVRNAPPGSLKDTLGKGWDRLDFGVFGEFDVYNYLATTLGDEPSAALAAAGWGSGWIGTYAKGTDESAANSDVLVHIRLDWDTKQDYAEFLVAYALVVQRVSGGTAELKSDSLAEWDVPGEHGALLWNDQLVRMDIVITSDAAARDTLSAVLQR